MSNGIKKHLALMQGVVYVELSVQKKSLVGFSTLQSRLPELHRANPLSSLLIMIDFTKNYN